MPDKHNYINNKHSQINKWIAELARLDALFGKTNELKRITFKIQLTNFSDTLKEMQKLLVEYERMDENTRKQLFELLENKWTELENVYSQSVSDFKRITGGQE